MSRRLWLSGALALLVVLAAGYAWRVRPNADPGRAPVLAGAPADMPVLQRGAYLARAADCVACHTAPGGQPFAGGLAFELPFGRIYSTNLTPDAATGLGAWTDDEFVRAMHEGVGRDGQRLYPAFPYTSFTQLSRADVLAIKAYLMSLPPVQQPARAPELSFPFNQRWGMGLWNAVFFRSERFQADPARPEVWNRGAYLANGLAHCAECHTPRNAGFALDHGQELAGASLEGWLAPNITSDSKFGLGSWSDREIVAYLLSGHAPGRGSAAGPMGEAVSHSLQHLAPADLDALVAYLRSVPAREGDPRTAVAARPQSVAQSSATAPPPNTPADLQAGLKLFESSCASCHRWDGQGRQVERAGLLSLRSVNDPLGRSLTKAVLDGVKLQIQGQPVFMPGFKDSMSDVEIAQLANYVIGHFSGKRGEVTADAVARQRTR